MAEKLVLKAMKCPTCGGELKAKNGTEEIICVYCGNSIVPVSEVSAPVSANATASAFSGSIKVDGIKTSSSALAYIELFFEEYDREAFSYAQTLSISEIDKLVNSLKESSADDKNTWFAYFKAIALPFIHKIEGCKTILAEIVEEYKNDDLDAYSKFDAYKRISTMILNNKRRIIGELEKIISYASKYGASPEEINSLKTELDRIKNLCTIDSYADIKDIPEIKAFIEENEKEVIAKLAAKGLNAQEEYQKAQALIAEQKNGEALTILESLRGYSDAEELIEKLDKYYLISNACEIGGKLYFFEKSSDTSEGHNLYPTLDGKILDVAIIKGIKEIITNYADILYFIDQNGCLKQFHFYERKETKITKKPVDKKNLHIYNKKMFILEGAQDEMGTYYKKDLISVDLATGTTVKLINGIKAIILFENNKVVYSVNEKTQENTSTVPKTHIVTRIADLDTLEITELGKNKVEVVGFIENKVIYTVNSPNKFNKDLYIRSLGSDEPAVLIEKNIFEFCESISDKIFYYVGNSKNRTLITINADGTERKELPIHISEILFEQAGWIYFIRKAGYTAILCKSRLDGSKFKIVATNIERYISFKNGYLYYLNDESALIKIRMDGSNAQKLCKNVLTVLSVKEDKIIFISLDDKVNTSTSDSLTSLSRNVRSIYAVDFTGCGIRKLVYNVKEASKYDEDTIYYTATREAKVEYSETKNIDELHKLDIETYNTEHILDLKLVHKSTGILPHEIALYVAIAAFCLGFICLFVAPALGVLLLTVGCIALLIRFVLKNNILGVQDLKNFNFDFNEIKNKLKEAADNTQN